MLRRLGSGRRPRGARLPVPRGVPRQLGPRGVPRWPGLQHVRGPLGLRRAGLGSVLAVGLAALLTACPGPSNGTLTLSIDPPTYVTSPGAAPRTFTATLQGGGGTVQWTLAGPGSVSTTTGLSTRYTPPPSVPGSVTATLRAGVVGTAVSASADITVTPVASDLGNLDVYVGGLDDTGATANVLVSGPDGYSESLSASRTLIDLAPGAYEIAAGTVRVLQDGIEDLRYPVATCNIQPLTLGANSHCVADVTVGSIDHSSVVYEQLFGSGRLYVPTGEDTIAGLPGSQLSGSNAEAPAVSLAGFAGVQSVAFDADGDMWLTAWGGNVLVEVRSERLLSSGSLVADVSIGSTSGSLVNPVGLAIAPDGSVWVSNTGNATVVRFGAEQLAASGSPVPEVTLSDDGSMTIDGPAGIAFDAVGTLWVASRFTDRVVGYTDPGSLRGALNASPDIIIDSNTDGVATLDAPTGLAFDEEGDLWVTTEGNTLVEYAPEQLETSGAPLPGVILTGLAGPTGLAFDAAGNLWVSNGSSLVAFRPEQLTRSGAPEPAVELTGIGNGSLGAPAFDPPPRWSPLPKPDVNP